MRRRGRLLTGTAVAVLLAAACPSPAEERPSRPQLELSVSRTPPPTPPSPSPQILQKDAEEAITAIQERQRVEQAAREAVRAWERQPNLQRDVVQGIQSLGIRDALRRR